MDAAVGGRRSGRKALAVLAVVAVVTLTAVAVTGVVSRSVRSSAPACPSPAPPPTVIMTVGDSITAGIVMDRSLTPSYRGELGRLLDAACVPHTFVVTALDATGCGHWTPLLADQMAAHHPDVVMIACGTNDRMDDKTAAQVTAWEGVYGGLIDAALSADPDVVVYPAYVQYSAGRRASGCLPPQWYSQPWQPESEAKVNEAIARVVASRHEDRGRVPAVVDYQIIPESYLDDCGVHPAPGGYDVMGRIAYNTIGPRLGAPPVPVPCGLTGRRPGGPGPDWKPCQRMNLNP